MADPVLPVTPVVTPAAPVPALPTPSADPATPQFVTIEQHNAVLARLDGISGAISGLKRTTPALIAPTKPPENQSLEEQFAAFRTERDAEQKRLADERRENAMQAAINSVQGLDDEARELLLAHVNQKYGSQITVDGKNVIYTAPDQSKKDLKALLGEVMQGVGKRFIPAKSVPGGEGLGGGKQVLDRSVKPTYEQLMANPKLLIDWTDADPEYVMRIQDEALLKMRTKK